MVRRKAAAERTKEELKSRDSNLIHVVAVS